MTDKFKIVNVGTDSSGRPILMTRYMKAALAAVKADWRVKPFADKIVITQGAFMSHVPGGGADASAGYHDLAGCVDFRIWNLTDEEAAKFTFVLRCYGFAAWRRLAKFGWSGEEHIHATLGGDSPYTPGARDSWVQYQQSQNGLADHAADYERRPNPLVTSFTGSLDQPVEDDALTPEDRDFIKNQFDHLEKKLSTFRQNTAERDKKLSEKVSALRAAVEGLPKSAATKKQVEVALDDLAAELKAPFESSH